MLVIGLMSGTSADGVDAASVEWPEGPVFFAINIEMPRGAEDLAKREGIAREVLESIGALPTS